MSDDYFDYDDFSQRSVSEYVRRSVKALTARSEDFDSVVVRGVSGLAVGSVAAYLVSKPIVVVRKPGESSHTLRRVSNMPEVGKRYVVVDDFVCTGETLQAIHDAVVLQHESNASYWAPGLPAPEFVGCFQYHQGEWYAGENVPKVRPSAEPVTVMTSAGFMDLGTAVADGYAAGVKFNVSKAPIIDVGAFLQAPRYDLSGTPVVVLFWL